MPMSNSHVLSMLRIEPLVWLDVPTAEKLLVVKNSNSNASVPVSQMDKKFVDGSVERLSGTLLPFQA